MIKTEKEFYNLLKEAIEKVVGNDKKDFNKIKEVSRASYYNIVNIAEGSKKAPRLSKAKIDRVCEELNIPFEELYFKLNSN